ncbi:MAG: Ig-like domain-containing protein, partial [Blautia sp.]|nr:Ig-like domain-containing protein [Blautia sp.]
SDGFFAPDAKIELWEDAKADREEIGVEGVIFADDTVEASGPLFTEDAFVSEDAFFESDALVKEDKKEEIYRYTALVLDNSGSMSGNPARVQREAAKKFCEAVLKAEGHNYVSLINFSSSASVKTDFIDRLEDLESALDSTSAIGGTNIKEALETAQEKLDTISQGEGKVIKNLVLCSDGIPESGSFESTGKYTKDDHYYSYGYGNAALNMADQIKARGYTIYTLGFFHSLSGSDLTFGRQLLKDIASGKENYYEVDDAEKLLFTFGEMAEDITTDDELKKITFTYQSGSDYTSTCYYSNNYFKESSYQYNDSLATMSLCLAMSAFGSGDVSDYKDKSKNARQLLKDMDFQEDSIAINDWFTVKPSTDSIAVIAGSKKIKLDEKSEEFTLVAFAVRGGGYEREWAGNFALGKSGLHTGFQTCKEQVLSFMKDYLKQKGITGKVKFWITGYSRAAATSNLVAAELDDGYVLSSDISYGSGDIYTYTFETPAGALLNMDCKNPKYNNIYNIINDSDVVPYVAPSALGFGRYGYDYYLPSPQSTPNYSKAQKDMLPHFKELKSVDEYVIDDFTMKKIHIKNWLPGGEKISFVQDDKDHPYTQGVFLSNYVDIIAKEFMVSRTNFVQNYQDEIREILSVLFGCSDAQQKVIMDYLGDRFKSDWGELIGGLLNPFKKNEDLFKETLAKWIKDALKKADVTGANDDLIDSAAVNLANLVLDLAISHPNYMTSAVQNFGSIAQGHFPEVCLSWLRSRDKNYNGNASTGFNNGGYRIIHVNCPVDVRVYDKNHTMVGGITSEAPNASNEVLIGFDENQQKTVILPNSEDYQIEIEGYDSGNVNVNLMEFSALAGTYTRNMNYFDVPIEKNKVLTLSVPAYEEEELSQDTVNGSSAAYTLKDDDGEVIEPSHSEMGTDQTYYTITVSPSNENYGVATGSGSYKYGEYALLECYPQEGYEFVVWTKNGNNYAEEETIQVRVSGNATYVAVFRKKAEPKVEITLSPKSKTINVGDTFTIKAKVSGSEDSIKWSSSKKSVAKVNNGTVEGVKAGTATITAKIGNAKATCKVTVIKPKLKLSAKKITLEKGDKETLKATVTGASKKVTFSSKNKKIAKVNKNGTVTAVKVGKTKIVAKANGLKAECTVVVTATEATNPPPEPIGPRPPINPPPGPGRP